MRKLIVYLLLILLLAGCAKPAAEEPAVQPEVPATVEPETVPEPVPEEPEADLFVFTRENLPKLDGSTSMVPLGEAVLAALLGESQNDAADLVDFHRTTESFRYLMRGESDLLLVAEPNQIVFDEMAQQGFEYEMEPIAKEALVFIVNSDNPIRSLTVEQLQGIYTGEITNWSQVGGQDVDIVPFQRNSTSGSQVLMDKLVMGDLEMMEAPQEWVPGEMDSLMQGVRGYEDSAAAIGYSVYYYAEDMRMAEGMKIISIEGVEPTDSTIADGSYPLINYYFSVIGAETEENSPTRILFDWLRSPAGQALLESQGYVPAGASVDDLPVYMDTSGLTGFDQPVEIYTRHMEDFVETLVPGAYGLLRPYIGSRAAFDMTIYGGQDVLNGSMGLIDDTGAIVVDPVYADVRYLYDQATGDALPFYQLSKERWIDNDWGGYMSRQYGFCSLDGSISIPCRYEQITCCNGRIIAIGNSEAGLFHVYDLNGEVLLDSVSWPERPSIYLSDGMGTATSTENLLFFSVRVPNGNAWDVSFCLYDWQGNLISDAYDWVELSGEGPYLYNCWETRETGYLDRFGRKTLERDYTITNPFYHGQALVKFDGKAAVIDPENRTLWEPERYEISACHGDTDVFYLCQAEGKWKAAVYNSSFELLFPDADKVVSLDQGLFLLWKDRECILSDGENFVTIGELDPAQSYSAYSNGAKDRILLQCYLQYARDYWLFDASDLRLLSSGRLENAGVNLIADRYTGESVAVQYSAGINDYPYQYVVLQHEIAPSLDNVRVLGIYHGWYLVEDDFSSGYMDADGNWLFRVSLMTDMTD